MSIATEPLIKAFLGVNVHPADLSITSNGKRKYTGDHAVRDAILSGERQLRSTTHIVEPEVDNGRILIISYQSEVNLPEGFDPNNKIQVDLVSSQNQNRLKEIGDWNIFPLTIELLSKGAFVQDEQGNLYCDNHPIPQGVRLA
jgi:folate-dependent phosphoribosylglycinamide formyltransferase PurN